jgi:hypothetical protein
MFWFLTRNSVLLALLLSLPIFAIRAQPYDDSELRAFLMPPEGCPAPCFMGIRPGLTTTQAATAILGAQPLLANTIAPNPPNGIRFRANRPQGLVEDTVFSYLRVESNMIQWLRVQTNISLGDVWAAYGQPDWGSRVYTMGSSYIYYAIGYNQADISFEFAINIERGQIDIQDIYRQKVTLRIGNTMKEYANMNPRLWRYTNPDLSWWHAS